MHALTTLIATAIAVGASAPAPAQAQEARSARVATHDLDLATAKGQRQLKRRIARVADALCETVNPRFDAKVRVAQRACRETAIATAETSVATKIRLTVR